MKRLLVLTLFFTACSTAHKEIPIRQYECAILGGHGTWAHVDIGAHYIEEAEEITEQVRKKLADMEKVPKETWAMCHLKEEK